MFMFSSGYLVPDPWEFENETVEGGVKHLLLVDLGNPKSKYIPFPGQRWKVNGELHKNKIKKE